MTEDVWFEQDTNPDAIEAALRRLLFRRHAENEALVPARVLNLVVIVDRDWKGEIANRLERVGRYQASRTVLCAVEEGRTQLDAVATVSYEEPGAGTIGVAGAAVLSACRERRVDPDPALAHLQCPRAELKRGLVQQQPVVIGPGSRSGPTRGRVTPSP